MIFFGCQFIKIILFLLVLIVDLVISSISLDCQFVDWIVFFDLIPIIRVVLIAIVVVIIIDPITSFGYLVSIFVYSGFLFRDSFGHSLLISIIVIYLLLVVILDHCSVHSTWIRSIIESQSTEHI